jgi:hypothetical protein
MDSVSSKSRIALSQWLVLGLSLAGAAIYGSYMLRSPQVRLTMFNPSGSFLYVVPIVVPFVAFLFDRAERWRQLSKLHYLIDLIVVGTAMGRVIANVPLVSGHTLFLTYAILTSRSIVVRVTAVLVIVQTIYLKYFLWHDFVTSTVGILLGSLAAFLASRVTTKESEGSQNG